MAKSKRKTNKSKVKKIITLIILILITIFILVCYFNPQIYNKIIELINPQTVELPDGEHLNVDTLEDVEVHFIDVGQGDCILITLPDYKNVLIDAGDRNNSNNEHIIEYVKENAHKNSYNSQVVIDHFILTHPDADHIGGADEVFEAFDVKKVYRPYVLYDGDYEFPSDFNMGVKKQGTATYKEFLLAIQNEKYGLDNRSCEWEFFNHESDFSGGAIFDDVKYTYFFDFLTPTTNLEDIVYTDVNDYSPLIRFSYQNVSVLLTGDAEEEAEEDFLQKYSNQTQYLDVDVLKVSHHGSQTSTTQEFLDLVKPEYAVISCGEGNTYYHPHAVTLNRLFNMQCNLYRTDKNGDIKMNINSLGEFDFIVDKLGEGMFDSPKK